MYKLNCFARNFSSTSCSFIFQHAPEKPTEGPKPMEGYKKEVSGDAIAKGHVDSGNKALREAYKAEGYSKDAVTKRPEYIAAKNAIDNLSKVLASKSTKEEKEISDAYKNATQLIDAAKIAGAINDNIARNMEYVAYKKYRSGLSREVDTEGSQAE